jgi:hypothetical protein
MPLFPGICSTVVLCALHLHKIEVFAMIGDLLTNSNHIKGEGLAYQVPDHRPKVQQQCKKTITVTTADANQCVGSGSSRRN